MSDPSGFSGTGMDVVDGCLIVPVNGSMEPEAVRRLSKAILARVNASQIKGVIINVSAIKVMDSYGFTILSTTAKALEMLGARTIFVGFQPGVVSFLVDLDMNLENIRTAVTTQDAFGLLKEHLPGFEQQAWENDDNEAPDTDGNDDGNDNDDDDDLKAGKDGIQERDQDE